MPSSRLLIARFFVYSYRMIVPMPTLLIFRTLTVLLLSGLFTMARAESLITMTFESSISESCSIQSDGGAINLTFTDLDFTTSNSVTVPLTVTCNIPSLINIVSNNGGFVNQQARAQNLTGGVDEVEYSFNLDLPGLVSTGQTPSDALQQVVVYDGNSGAFQTEGTLTVSWNGATDLYAGTYTDQVTISLQPNP